MMFCQYVGFKTKSHCRLISSIYINQLQPDYIRKPYRFNNTSPHSLKMGILFMYFDPDNKNCLYKLVMVQSRDETLDKPSESADFWDSDENIISGRDPSPTKYATESSSKVGTSFGIDLRGRVGAFLEIEPGVGQQKHSPGGTVALRHFFDDAPTLDKSADSGRGRLKNRGYEKSLRSVRDGYQKYQPFQLITGQCGSYYDVALRKCLLKHARETEFDQNHRMAHDDSGYSDESFRTNSPTKNSSTEGEENPNDGWRFDYTNTLLNIKEELEPGRIHAFCNSRQNPHVDSRSGAWKKVSEGKDRFEAILKAYGGDLKEYRALVKGLLELMKDHHFYLPDRNLENELASLDYGPEEVKNMSSIFINPTPLNTNGDPSSQMIPASQYYGTRTINVLVIDSKNNVDFMESRLHYPVCLKNQVWNPTKFSFNLKVGSHI